MRSTARAGVRLSHNSFRKLGFGTLILGRLFEHYPMRKPRDFGASAEVYRKRPFLEDCLNAGYAPKYLVTEFSEVRLTFV
jgi:hypothetical protein